MKIKTNLIASKFISRYTFDTSDFDMTDEDWNELSYLEKREYLRNAVRELPEQPFWTLDNFEEL